MTRIKLVLAQPKVFVLSEQWQVTVATMRWIINHLPILSGDTGTEDPGVQQTSVIDRMWSVANFSASGRERDLAKLV